MNILTLSRQQAGHGAFQRHQRMIHALVDAGHTVFLMAPGKPAGSRAHFVRFRLPWLPYAGFIGLAIKLLWTRWMHRARLQNIHAVLTLCEYDALACRLAFRSPRMKHILMLRGDTCEIERFNRVHRKGFKDRWIRPITIAVYPTLQRLLIPKLDRVSVQAGFLRDSLLKRLKRKRANVSVLPNDSEPCAPEFTPVLALLKGKDAPLIGLIAPLYWRGKGVALFLDAMRILSKSALPFRGVIIGYGPDEDKVKRYISGNSLEDHVAFIGKLDRVKRYLHQLDIIAAPTEMPDACPNLVLEAMQSETALLASRIPAHEALLEHAPLLFNSGDANDLAEKLTALMTDRAVLRENIRLVKQRKATFTFDWDRQVVRFITGDGHEA